jgi:hypothetical protein
MNKFLWSMILLVSLLLSSCVTVASDAGADVYTWEDLNCNKVPDEGEPPLAGVCVELEDDIRVPTPSISPKDCGSWITNEEGHLTTGIVASTCNEIFVAVISPDGYQPTTNVVNIGCSQQFGFAKESSCQLKTP